MAQEDQLECGTIQSHVSWSGGSERMEGGLIEWQLKFSKCILYKEPNNSGVLNRNENWSDIRNWRKPFPIK